MLCSLCFCNSVANMLDLRVSFRFKRFFQESEIILIFIKYKEQENTCFSSVIIVSYVIKLVKSLCFPS